MRHNFSANYKNVTIRPLQKDDIEKLRIWRNDSEKTKYLRKIDNITPEMQQQWFEKYLDNNDEIMFAIEETEQLKRMVGSVALYNFKGNTAELGKIQIGDEEAHGRGLGKVSKVMAMLIGFRKLGLEKIVGAVHRENIAAHRNDMQIGFYIVGAHDAPMGGVEDEMEMVESRLIEVNSYVSDIVLNE